MHYAQEWHDDHEPEELMQLMQGFEGDEDERREQFHKAELNKSRNANIKEILQSMKDANGSN